MTEAVGIEPEGEGEDVSYVDVFSPRWHEGYVIGRKGLGTGALEIAEARAARESGATGRDGRIADVRDGFEVGEEEAKLLPHRITLRLAVRGQGPAADGVTEVPMREFASDPELGFYTGDPVEISMTDLDGEEWARALGRVTRADIQAGRVSVYIERVDG